MRISDWSSDVCSSDLDAKVPSSVASRIQAGSQVTVVAGGEHIAGKVLRSAHRTSEATRNAPVRIEVPNKDDRLHAGDFVEVYFDAKTTANIDNKTATQMQVTNHAVLQLGGDTDVLHSTHAHDTLDPFTCA